MESKKILVLGSTGMLGHKVSEILRAQYGTEFVTLTSRDSDKIKNVENSFSFNALINTVYFQDRYDYIINCIGIIKPFVKEVGHIRTIEVNSIFPHKLAKYCEKQNTKLIHITTDCVFSGEGGGYTEDDVHDANDVYGKSKSRGEPTNCMCLRTSIIGEEQYNNASLVEWVKSQKGKEVNGFTNHYWNGVSTAQYAKILIQIMEKDLFETGIFHVFSPVDVTKYDLLQFINNRFDLNLKINAVEANKSIDRTLRTVKGINSKLNIPYISDQVLEM